MVLPWLLLGLTSWSNASPASTLRRVARGGPLQRPPLAARPRRRLVEVGTTKSIEDDLAEAELWLKASDLSMHASVEDDVVESPVTTAFDWDHSILNFLHVPKSGGSVVKQILWGWGEERQKRIVDHGTIFGDLSKEEQDETIAIWGHRGYGTFGKSEPGSSNYRILKCRSRPCPSCLSLFLASLVALCSHSSLQAYTSDLASRRVRM